jgi:flagellin
VSSILTNASAMTALTTLRAINSDLDTAQNRISTGKSVSTAADNAAYWSIATTMNSDNSTLKAITTSLGLSKSQADTSQNGINALVGLVKDYRDRLASAAQPGVDKDKISTELDQLKEQMTTIIKSSSTNGVNWLNGTGTGAEDDATSFNIISGITRTAGGDDGATTFDKIEITYKVGADGEEASASDIIDTITNDLDGESDSDGIETKLTAVDNALANLTKLGSVFGAVSTRIKLQVDFQKTLSDALSRGVGALVDADMETESTRLKALQTQQQLAVQALSIANSNTQTILSLFRN